MAGTHRNWPPAVQNHYIITMYPFDELRRANNQHDIDQYKHVDPDDDVNGSGNQQQRAASTACQQLYGLLKYMVSYRQG